VQPKATAEENGAAGAARIAAIATGPGRVAAIVDAPESALPWLDRFYDEDDAALLEALAEGRQPISALARGSGGADSGGGESGGLDAATVRRAHRRAVVTITEGDHPDSTVEVASFWDRFGYWILFEGWRDIPVEAREPLAEGFLQHYVDEIALAVADLKTGRPISDGTTPYHYVLYREAQELARGSRRAFVRPCPCRRTFQRCDAPVDVCLWFDEDEREAGWEISGERALELLAEADRAALTFTSDTTVPGSASWICCCCSDCCLPILAAERLDAAALWPRRRHVMSVDHERCTRCRVCVKRCPFDALTMDGKGKDGVLRLDAAACRGCGVCETGCKEGAIAMVAL
jgi:Pyruvate/2-oxoacid:ferredoxin oxidoreductase delta subunit